MALEKIYVKPTGTDSRVVLYEQHPEHPDGEIFIAAHEDAKPVQVAKTPAVLGKLATSQLVETTKGGKEKGGESEGGTT